MLKVFVDADTLLYSAAAVTERRSIKVTHKPTSIEKQFDNRTMFKQAMQNKQKQITDDYLIEDLQEPEPASNCLQIVKNSIETIYNNYDFSDIVFCAGDSNNFRLDLPLPYRYKLNRAGTIRPVNLKAAHQFIKKQYNAVSPSGWEVDDHVAILAYQAVEEGHEAVILSRDKDARQFVGLNVGDYDTKLDALIKINAMHPVQKINSEFKSYGVPWLAMQATVGDGSDFYRPTDCCSAKYGKISAYKDLVDLTTPQQILLKVIEKYKQWYPDKFHYTAWDGVTHEADWKSMLRLYFKCAKMKEHLEDQLIADVYFEKYGVYLE